MKWSLEQLYKYHDYPLEFNGITKYDEYIKTADILRMDEVKYNGTGRSLDGDVYEFNIHIETTLYLEDSRTLEEVEFPINIDVCEVFGKDPDNDEMRYIEKNTIDLYDIIWAEMLRLASGLLPSAACHLAS